MSKISTATEMQSTSKILLTPFTNGGWTIQIEAETSYVMGTTVGAYSNTADMLIALGKIVQKKED